MLAVVGSQSLVAGYLQVAALSLFIFGVYAVMRLWIEIQTQAKKARAFARWAAPAMIFALLGVLLALPQILLTFQMAIESNRTGTSEAYAYVGSLSPLALFTLLLPNLQGLFRGNCLYGGFFAFFCVLAASKQGEKNGVFFKVWAVLSIFCLLLALGQWSPLYVGLIKLTHFYSFRTPAKFLIFFNFSLAMLAAIGFQKLWLSCENEKGRMWIRWKGTQFIVTLGLISGFIFIAKYALIFQRDYLTSLGEWVLRETLYGRAGHPHSWDVYQTKLQEMLAFADDVFSFKYRWTVWITGVFACGVAWGIWLKKTKRLRGALIAGFFLLAADLYGFSYADLRSDFSEYAQVEPQNKTIKTLMKARSQNTLGRIYGLRIGDQVPSLIPSVNMLYAIEDVGSYSPLVSSRY